MSLHARLRVLVLVVTSWALSACSQLTGGCGTVGLAPNGVTVTVDGVPTTTRSIVVQACIAQICRSGTAAPSPPGTAVVVIDHPMINSTMSVEVTVTARDGRGKQVVPALTRTVTPDLEQPNGPGCGEGYHANISVTATN